MKTIGIAMLFGMCSLIGFHLSMRKTAELKTVRALKRDLGLFSERILSDGETLTDLISEQKGPLFKLIERYIERLLQGGNDADAAAYATESLNVREPMRSDALRFLTGLCEASRADLVNRTQAFASAADRAGTDAEESAKQARVLRISGVLVGAGLAILLM